MPSLGVKALVINADNQVLLVEHTYQPGWHLPGGGVDRNEAPVDAVIRELIEETGVRVKQMPAFFAVYKHKIFGADDYPLLYIVKQFEVLENAILSREIKKVGWFSPNALPENTTESTRLRIDEVLHNKTPEKIW